MAEFWIRNTTASEYTVDDLGLSLPAAGEIDLHVHYFFEAIRASEDLDTALSSGDLVRLTGEGGSVVPYSETYDDIVLAHKINGDGHFGALSTDEVMEGSNLYYTENRVSDNTDVAANISHRNSTANPHSTDLGNLGSGTLAELNSVVADATLDDSGASRTPTGHAGTHNGDGSDPIATATDSVAGLLSSTDKAKLDDVTLGNLSREVYNESGSQIDAGKLVAVVGWNSTEDLPTIDLADKDTPGLRPASGISLNSIPNDSNGEILITGTYSPIDTSAWSVNDQLVLGNNGDLSRPPPGTDPFTGEVQTVGHVVGVGASAGSIIYASDGLNIVTASQRFALEGSDGTPSKTNPYVTHSDDRLRKPQNYLRVSPSGGDYTSIKSAVDYAVSQGGTWEIIVFPGTYNEDPMTIQSGITISTHTANRMDIATVVANNSAEDLFTCTGGYIGGLEVTGVTDASKALFRMSTSGSLTTLHGVSVYGCSTGIEISNGARVVATDFSINIATTGAEVTTGISVSGNDSYFGCVGAFFSVPSALIPAYAVNPVQTAVSCSGSGSEVYVVGATFRIANKDTTADTLVADDGCRFILLSSEVSECYRGARIGSSGSDTTFVINGCAFFDNTINGQSDSSTGVFLVNAASDEFKWSAVSGSVLSGVVQALNFDRTFLSGDLSYWFTSQKAMALENWFHDQTSTGISDINEGIVTDGGGLTVDVSPGHGWITRNSPNNDSFDVSWSAVTGVSLTANSSNYVGYDSVSESITSVTSIPGPTTLQLAIVETSAMSVRFIHQRRNLVHDFDARLQDYLATTRRIVLKSGLAVTTGSVVTKFEVTSGDYYNSLDVIDYVGSGGDATFSYFYGFNGANEIGSQTDVDTSNYDNSGTLTAMTVGYYRSDTVILTSDGRVSVIYGTAEYSTQSAAEAASLPTQPTFIESSGIYLSRLIVQEGNGIVEFVDERPVGQPAGAGGTAITVHGNLAGLSADDHPQYLPVNGTRSMGGSLDMGGNNVSNVGTVDGITVSSHSARHNPGGSDAITTGTPVSVQVGASPSEGTNNAFSRSDHQHGITTGTPVDVANSNSSGSASSVSRSDHVHAGLDRNANDFNTFTEKTSATSTDLLLIEDSMGGGAKKNLEFGTLEGSLNHLNIQNIGTNTHAQIDSHIADISNPHSVTKAQVGLGNVTNDAQVKKGPSSTNDAIPRWDGTTGDLLQDSGVIIDDNDRTTWPDSGASKLLVVDPPNDQVVIGPDSAEPTYRVTLRGPSSVNGIFAQIAGDAGTSPLHIENHDGSTQLLHLDANTGRLGLGTILPSYGVSNSLPSGDSADYDTKYGLYRIGGNRANDAVTVYDSLGNQTFTGITQLNLDSTTVIGDIYTLNIDEIQINVTGRYLISYQVTLDISSGTSRTSSFAGLYIDPDGSGTYSLQPETKSYGYHRNSSNGIMTFGATVVKDLTSNNRLVLGATRLSGFSVLSTVADATRLTIQRLS